MENSVAKDIYDGVLSIPTQIRILGGPNNTESQSLPELDIISADEQEAFTLEDFKSIIIEFKKENRDFILARITTPDPYRQDVLYNYYYTASEINKLLFKYESDRRLLHRMKVRNPLNNMYIIGQVYYYIISLAEIDRAIVDYYFYENKKNERGRRRAFSAVFRTSNYSFQENTDFKKKAKDTSDLEDNLQEYNIATGKNPEEIIEEVKSGCLKIPTKHQPDKKLTYEAKYFACDDDFLMRAEIREIFRKNSLDPEEDFLFELDRTQNDIFALLDSTSEGENEGVLNWKRVLTVHMSLLMTMLGIVILLGANPIILLIAFPLAILILISFLGSLLYILFVRRVTFGSLAVRSVDDV